MSENLKSLSLVERKEYEELKNEKSEEQRLKKERTVFLGFFVIALIATLMISGAMNFV
jgi:hypothetical protein